MPSASGRFAALLRLSLRGYRVCVVLLVVCVAWGSAAGDEPVGSEAQSGDLFERQVRTILSGTCFQCHGPDEKTREADLRLDTSESASEDRGGYAAIVPGDLDASEAWQRLVTEDDDLKMPPPDSGLEVTPEQAEAIRRWIETGAVYRKHWAFRPIVRPIPEESALNPWARNPIDTFVWSRMQDVGLVPSSVAEPQVLLRRLRLDLLGLAPSRGLVERFVEDDRPDAYSRQVDRALASPHFGERWGRHWLDQARYADTHGYTVDSQRTMWPYRDWVIAAINDDLSFDQFTVEQIAGDLLPEPSQSQLIATGFHRNTLINQEGGSDPEQFRVEAAVDRTNTTGAVWLGLTVGCAQCHTHKFDPLSQREYYQLYAYFNHSQDRNSVAPTIEVPSGALKREIEEQQAVLRELEARLAELGPASEAGPVSGEGWSALPITSLASRAGSEFEQLEDASYLVSGAVGDEDVYRLVLEPESGGTMRVLRLETLTDPSLPQQGPGRAGNGNFVLNEMRLLVNGQPVGWAMASADHSQADYPVSAAIDGDASTGWAINVSEGSLNVPRTAWLVLEEPLQVEDGSELVVEMVFGPQPPKYNIGRFRLTYHEELPQAIGLPDPKRRGLEQQVAGAKKRLETLKKQTPTTMVMRELAEPRETFVMIRGDFLRHGERVDAATPDFLPQLPVVADETHDRLDLARWLVTPDNPLPRRVLSNRMWMRLFGRGLVETENDFGSQGTPPTHPQLLDWLASDWLERDWSRKRLIRRIVTSATYRQSSVVTLDRETRDPQNLWLSRQNRIRVEAEIVRDLALSVSGAFHSRIGGPSVYPPQPDGVYAFTQRQASWPTSRGADRYRRGMYTFFMRSAPHPMLTTFDSPRFNTVCTRRIRSNTPLQSLTVANDEAMIEMARAFAERVVHEAGDETEARIEFAFEVALGRRPTELEVQRLSEYLDTLQASFVAEGERAAELIGKREVSGDAGEQSAPQLAAWIGTCRVLMNLDEFITRE